jgi:hypothetical protein
VGKVDSIDQPEQGLDVGEGVCTFFTGKSRIREFFNRIFELTGYNPIVFQPAQMFLSIIASF